MRFIMLMFLGACTSWSKTNTVLELAFAGAQAADLHQTSEAVTYCGEANPIIGACGEHVSPQGYFLTTTLIHLGIAAALPRKWREAFQAATILTQSWNVYTNIGPIQNNRVGRCADRVGTDHPCFP